MIETTVLHPESETEIISPLSRKGAASGEFQRRKKTRVAVLAGRGGEGTGRREFSGSGAGVGSGSAGTGAVAGASGSGDAANGPAAREGAGGGSGAVEKGFGREGTGGGFFARCLAQGRGATAAERKRWRSGVYDQIQEVMRVQGSSEKEEGKASGSLSVEKMCQVAVVSRAGYYRSFAERCPGE